MSASGTRSFDPQFAELMSEAYARIQIRPLSITQEHIDEGIRSANLMLVSMALYGMGQYQMSQSAISLVQGTATYDLPAGALDIWSAVHRRADLDTPVWPFSRSDYHHIPSKDQEGRPFNYFADRGVVGAATRSVTLWPTPDRTGDELVCWFLMKSQDATGLPENISTSYEYFEAYAANLTARLAEKFAPGMFREKLQLAEMAMQMAQTGNRERAPARMRMRGYTRGRRF
jgi:hypothetical protein